MAFFSILTPEQARLAGVQVWDMKISGWGDNQRYVSDPDTFAYGKYPPSPPLVILSAFPPPPGNASQFILPPSVSLSIAPDSTVDVVRVFSFPPFVNSFPSVSTRIPTLPLFGEIVSVKRPFVGQTESHLTVFQFTPEQGGTFFPGPPAVPVGPRGAVENYFPIGGFVAQPFATSPVYERPVLSLQFHLRQPSATLTSRSPYYRGKSRTKLVPGVEDIFILPVGGRNHIRVMARAGAATTFQLTGLEQMGAVEFWEYSLTAPVAVAANTPALFVLNNPQTSWLILKADAIAGAQVFFSVEASD